MQISVHEIEYLCGQGVPLDLSLWIWRQQKCWQHPDGTLYFKAKFFSELLKKPKNRQFLKITSDRDPRCMTDWGEVNK